MAPASAMSRCGRWNFREVPGFGDHEWGPFSTFTGRRVVAGCLAESSFGSLWGKMEPGEDEDTLLREHRTRLQSLREQGSTASPSEPGSSEIQAATKNAASRPASQIRNNLSQKQLQAGQRNAGLRSRYVGTAIEKGMHPDLLPATTNIILNELLILQGHSAVAVLTYATSTSSSKATT